MDELFKNQIINIEAYKASLEASGYDKSNCPGQFIELKKEIINEFISQIDKVIEDIRFKKMPLEQRAAILKYKAALKNTKAKDDIPDLGDFI